MTVVEVQLPGPLALVPSQGAMRRLGHDLPDPVTLAAELTRLSQRDGLPARIDESRGRPSLAVYTDSCVLWLGLTQNGDAYRINGAAPKGSRTTRRWSRARCSCGPGRRGGRCRTSRTWRGCAASGT